MKTFLPKIMDQRSVLVLSLIFLMPFWCYSTNISVSGVLATNTVWSADTVKVTGNVTVNNGIVLTINSGKVIQFQGNYKLIVLGRLLANGETSKNIIFTVKDTTGLYDTNIANGGWHGIRFEPATSTNDTSKLAYCRFEYGKSIGAGNDGYGGAVFYNNLAKVKIRNSIFKNCYALKGGAVYGNSLDGAAFFNSLFYKNASVDGGAVFLSASAARFVNCSFAKNRADNGGAFYLTDSDPQIVNTILWNNAVNQAYLADDLSDPVISYSNVEGGKEAFAGPGSLASYTGTFSGNINDNPLFLDADVKMKLQCVYGSPCINAGNPTLTGLETGTADLGGNTRVSQSQIDIGCYETQIPYFKKHLNDIDLTTNIGTISLDLSAYFGLVASGDSFIYTPGSGIDTSNVTFKINKGTLTLTSKANKTGVNSIIIKATTAYNFTLTDTFAVNVKFNDIPLVAPVNGYRFTLRDSRILQWYAPVPSSAGGRKYILKMVLIEDGQSAEEAIASNANWYCDTSSLITNNYSYNKSITNRFPSYQKIAWQIKAIDANNKEFACSGIRFFYGPPFMEAFYAGNSVVYVDTTTVLDIKNLAGRGRITIAPGKTVVVNYSNLVLGGSILSLQSGAINQSYKDTITLIPEYVPNDKARFYADTLTIDKDNIYLKGIVKWENNVLNSRTLISSHTKVLFSSSRLLGPVRFPNLVTGFKSYENSTIKIDSTSVFYLRGTNGYFMMLNGKITSLFDNNKAQKDTAVFSFSKAENLDYISMLPATGQKPIELNEMMGVYPENAILDLSLTKSPAVVSDPTWKGIWVNKYKIKFNAENKQHQLKLNTGDGIAVNSETWVKSKLMINSGLELNLDTTFTSIIGSRYNGFEGTIYSLRINRPAISETIDQVKGNVTIPYIQDNNPHDYVINFNGVVATDSLVERIDDFSFFPVTEKDILSFSVFNGTEKIPATINQADKKISFTLPVTADVTKVKAYFSTSGNYITINGTYQVRGVTENNFSQTQIYSVYAGDGSIQNYTVSESHQTAVPSVFSKDLSIYPNPASSMLYIQNLPESSVISVYSLGGKLLKQINCENNKGEIPVEDLATGLYLIKIKTRNGELQSKFSKH